VGYSKPQSVSDLAAYIMSAAVFFVAIISLLIYLSFNRVLKQIRDTNISGTGSIMTGLKLYEKISSVILCVLILYCIKIEAISLLAALVAYGIIIRIKIALMKKYLL